MSKFKISPFNYSKFSRRIGTKFGRKQHTTRVKLSHPPSRRDITLKILPYVPWYSPGKYCGVHNRFFFNVLPLQVRSLKIFCDSCAGQNKNYTIICFLHHVVHNELRFDQIKITFPIQGHWYLECDKDFALIKQKTRVEVPSQWVDVFKAARVKPNLFTVIECQSNFFQAWTKFLQPMYKNKSPIPTRPIKELVIRTQHPRTVEARDSHNGAMSSFVITPPKIQKRHSVPEHLYADLIPLPKLKYEQLQSLKKFVAESLQDYYTNLPCASNNTHLGDADMNE